MSRKQLTGFAISAFTLLMLAVVFVRPAGATPPGELNFTVERVSVVPSSSSNFGSWVSSGTLESSGGINERYFFAGMNEYGWFLKNSHTTILLSDDIGTITIKAQAHQVYFEPFGHFDVSGRWVILKGTGAYAGLHGQGNVDVSESFYGTCPANAYGVTGPCIIGHESYTGQGHFEP